MYIFCLIVTAGQRYLAHGAAIWTESLAVVTSLMLIGIAAIWLCVHLSVKRRFTVLDGKLTIAYSAAFAVPPQDDNTPRLIALAIDLRRKKHAAHPFASLSAEEKRIALYAFAVETLPLWMVKYKALGLHKSDRALIMRLCDIRTSQPRQKPQFFGAIEAEKKLRLATQNEEHDQHAIPQGL